MTHEEAIAIIRQSAYADHAAPLIERLSPSVRAVASGERAKGLAATDSYLGGQPHLPSTEAWPMWDRTTYLNAQIERTQQQRIELGRKKWIKESLKRYENELKDPVTPLGFIGQLNLSEVHRCHAQPHLPAEGLVSFFYDLEQETWGFDPRERGHCRVLYFPPGAELVESSPPKPLPEHAQYTPHQLSCTAEWTLPDGVDVLGDDWDYDKYFGLLDSLVEGEVPEEGMHRIGGHPSAVQGEMRLECQLVTNGLYCGDPSGYEGPRAEALRPGAADWKLLLQVDSHEEAMGWMWGDCGMLYFWAREQESSQGDFENAWCILQCH